MSSQRLSFLEFLKVVLLWSSLDCVVFNVLQSITPLLLQKVGHHQSYLQDNMLCICVGLELGRWEGWERRILTIWHY